MPRESPKSATFGREALQRYEKSPAEFRADINGLVLQVDPDAMTLLEVLCEDVETVWQAHLEASHRRPSVNLQDGTGRVHWAIERAIRASYALGVLKGRARPCLP